MNIEMIEQETTEIAEYSKTEAGLADLRARMEHVEYDVMTVKGMAIAKADRAEVRGLRTGIENTRKQIKAPALARCKLIDAEAARITAVLLKLETPIDEQIKAREAAIETEKAMKEAAERARIVAITSRIAAIREYVALAAACRTAARIDDLLGKLSKISLGDFEEFAEEAALAHLDAMKQVEAMLIEKHQQEQEQERIKAEQVAAAEKLALERKQMEEERAAMQANLDAQRAEQEAIAKRNRDAAIAEADRLASERQKLADETTAQRAAEQAEFNRQREELAAQRAEIDRQIAFEREQLEKEKAALAPAPVVVAAIEVASVVDAEVKPDDVLVLTGEMVSIPLIPEAPNAIHLICVIADYFKVSQQTAAEWLDAADFTTYY